jgi:hypothetical protein
MLLHKLHHEEARHPTGFINYHSQWYKAYTHIIRVQALKAEDLPKQVHFCEWLLQ